MESGPSRASFESQQNMCSSTEQLGKTSFRTFPAYVKSAASINPITGSLPIFHASLSVERTYASKPLWKKRKRFSLIIIHDSGLQLFQQISRIHSRTPLFLQSSKKYRGSKLSNSPLDHFSLEGKFRSHLQIIFYLTYINFMMVSTNQCKVDINLV